MAPITARISFALSSQKQFLTTVLIFTGTLIVFLATNANVINEPFFNDALYTAFPSWTLVHDHSLNIRSVKLDYGYRNGFFVQLEDFRLNAKGDIVGGRVFSDRFPGSIIFAVPFYALAGLATFSMVPANIAASVATAGAIAIMYRILLAIAPRKTALAATLLLAFATGMWTVASDTLWSEGPTLLALSLATWALTKNSYVLAALGYGLSIFCRPHTAVIGACSGIWLSITQRRFRPVVFLAIGCSAGLGLLITYNHANLGRWSILTGSYAPRISSAISTSKSGGQATITNWSGDYFNTFLSPLHGLFVYSPFLLVLLPGVYAGWKVAPAWVRSSAVGAVIYLIVQLAGNSWIGGDGYFGYRLVLVSLFLCVPLLVLSWQEFVSGYRWMRVAFAVLAVASLWWFALGSVTSNKFLGGVNGIGAAKSSDFQVLSAIHAHPPGAWLMAALFAGVIAWIIWPDQARSASRKDRAKATA